MAGDGILLVLEDGVIAHAGEVIVGVVVLAHVLEAEAPILVLAQPRPWARDASPRWRSPSNRSTAHRRARGGPRSGLTRMRSNKGESNFMTEHYAELAMTPSSLDRSIFPGDVRHASAAG